MKTAWTIAGSDSGGCSGIQNDLKTFSSLGVHGCSMVTALTLQNSNQIADIHYSSVDCIKRNIDILKNHFSPDAIKIGMVGDVKLIELIKAILLDINTKIVVDPVFISSSHYPLFQGEMADYISAFRLLWPYVDLLTPNISEAELLTSIKITSYVDIERAANKLLNDGAKSVLIKGGHFDDNLFSQDYWTNGKENFWLANKRLSKNCRGTGCALSSAIAACLALDYEIKDAIVIANMYVHQGIRLSVQHKHMHLFQHAGWPENESDLPFLSPFPLQIEPSAFLPCTDIGLYPVINNYEWLKKLIDYGVKTIQLRIKDKQGNGLEEEIKRCIQLAREYDVHLFINDYWELAIQYQAYGIHLGQEDISQANIEQIRHAGISLGVSTHCYYEVARAHTLKPSYIAFGPIFPTTSKIMPFSPQGLERLSRWRKTLSYPLVAIGGINHEVFDAVVKTKVNGIAMISAITEAKDPYVTTQEFLATLSGA